MMKSAYRITGEAAEILALIEPLIPHPRTLSRRERVGLREAEENAINHNRKRNKQYGY